MSRARNRAADARPVRAVLVVSADLGLREQVATWVDEAGYEVITCPGPHLPGHSCIGLRGERCPLDAVADLTVLDLQPTGADLVDRSGRAALVEIYQAGGRPVLVLADDSASAPQPGTAGTTVLERSADRGALLASVRELLSDQVAHLAPQPNFHAATRPPDRDAAPKL